jgi:hypothetical protein
VVPFTAVRLAGSMVVAVDSTAVAVDTDKFR